MDDEVKRFRLRARQSLEAARSEMSSGDSQRLPYAVLRLRMALEALTYERAYDYRDFLDPADSNVWQPKKVMDALLAIDSKVEEGGTFVLIPNKPDGTTGRPIHLGTEYPLSLSTLKKHYDALGSFLHLPTIKQLVKQGAPDLSSMQKHCEQVVAAVETVLSSSAYGLVPGHPVRFTCYRCENPIVRRVLAKEYEFDTVCPACKAGYRLSGTGGTTPHNMTIVPAAIAVQCHNGPCLGKHWLWPDEEKRGTSWSCQDCGARYTLSLYANLMQDNDSGTAGVVR